MRTGTSFCTIGLCMVATVWLGVCCLTFAERTGGSAQLAYESLNSAGISFATNGNYKLGCTLGQNGLIYTVTTNTAGEQFLNGFWKAESACVLYQPIITDIVFQTNQVGITFAVVNSNMYQVMYVDQEDGGLTDSPDGFTNMLTSLTGEGLAGSSTTVWHNVSGATDTAKFYLIKCED